MPPTVITKGLVPGRRIVSKLNIELADAVHQPRSGAIEGNCCRKPPTVAVAD